MKIVQASEMVWRGNQLRIGPGTRLLDCVPADDGAAADDAATV